MPATYSLELWDHEPAAYEDGRWSLELAAQHLDGPSTGLTAREAIQGIRRLEACGWSEYTIFVKREQVDYAHNP